MTIKWVALKATLEPHTVTVRGALMSGFLVRCTASRKELGYVWQTGNSWRWRTPDAANHGERSSQRAAVQVLRDAYDLRQQPSFLFGPPAPAPAQAGPPAQGRAQGQPSGSQGKAPAQGRAQAGPPAPAQGRAPAQAGPPAPAPPKRIVWSDQPTGDLTSAVADALRRGKP